MTGENYQCCVFGPSSKVIATALLHDNVVSPY